MATVARAFKATAPAAQRLRRTRDPLTSSSVAQHFTLPSGSHFVVRPPPSVLPPTLPVPPTEAALPHADKFAPTPFASAVHQPPAAASLAGGHPSLHAQQPQQANQHLVAPSRPRAPEAGKKLSPQEVQELQALRRSDSNYWTTGVLARKFGISRNTVTMLGFGEGIEAERSAAERRRVVEAAKARREERYGWRKAIAREERQRRKMLW